MVGSVCGLLGSLVNIRMVTALECVYAGQGHVTALSLAVEVMNARGPGLKWQIALEMEAGHPGHLGHSVALRVELDSKFASVPAVTLRHDMGAEYVLDRAEKKGSVMRTALVHCQSFGLSGVHGVSAVLSVEEGYITGREHVRMETAVLDVHWNIKPAIQSLAQRSEGTLLGPHGYQSM